MLPVYRRPWFPSLVLLFALGCSTGSSSSGSSGCGSSATGECSIELSATVCGNADITLECSSGAKPTTKSKCVVAYKDDTQTVYCCANEANLSINVNGNGGGGGS